MKKSNLKQFIKFALVGASNTIISYIVYSICYHGFNTNVHIANISGFVLSVLNAYIWQSKFVFNEDKEKEKRVWWKVLLKTYAAYAFTGLFLSEVLLLLWLEVIKIQQFMGPFVSIMMKLGIEMSKYDMAVSIAPFINLIVTIPINYIINKFWAYRQKETKD